VRGDVGIVFVPESELFCYVQQGETTHYARSAHGAYRAFFDSNIQADFVALEDVDRYPLVYLPYPVMLKGESAARLRAYVERGGALVSEGLPGYFGDHGRAGTAQPNHGLDELFGARESSVEFTPDLFEDLALEVHDHPIRGRYFMQEYEPKGGRVVGRYANGHAAAVAHRFGAGRTLLIGTFPGAGYDRHPTPDGRAFIADLLARHGVQPRLRTDNAAVQARLHTGGGGTYLWVVNPGRAGAAVTVTLSGDTPRFGAAEDAWGHLPVTVGDRRVTVTVPARDAAVIALR
jgi:beta-galactosidase